MREHGESAGGRQEYATTVISIPLTDTILKPKDQGFDPEEKAANGLALADQVFAMLTDENSKQDDFGEDDDVEAEEPMGRTHSGSAQNDLAQQLDEMCNEAIKLHMELKDPEEAIRLYTCVLDCDRTHVRAISNLGALYHREGMPSEAKLCYMAAIELDPHRYQSRYNLARLHHTHNEHDLAKKNYEQAIQNTDCDDITCCNAKAYLGLLLQDHFQDHDAAMQCYEEALAIDKFHLRSLDHRCALLLKMGLCEEAHAEHNKLLQLDPSHSKSVCPFIKEQYFGHLESGNQDPSIHSVRSRSQSLAYVGEYPGGYYACPHRPEVRSASPPASSIRSRRWSTSSLDLVFAPDNLCFEPVPSPSRGLISNIRKGLSPSNLKNLVNAGWLGKEQEEGSSNPEDGEPVGSCIPRFRPNRLTRRRRTNSQQLIPPIVAGFELAAAVVPQSEPTSRMGAESGECAISPSSISIPLHHSTAPIRRYSTSVIDAFGNRTPTYSEPQPLPRSPGDRSTTLSTSVSSTGSYAAELAMQLEGSLVFREDDSELSRTVSNETDAGDTKAVALV